MSINKKYIKKEKDGQWVIKSELDGLAEMVVDDEFQALTLVFSIKGIDSAEIIDGKSRKFVDANKGRKIKIAKNMVKASKAKAAARNAMADAQKSELKRTKQEAKVTKTILAEQKKKKLDAAKLAKGKATKKIDSYKLANKKVTAQEKSMAKMESRFRKRNKRIASEVKWADGQIAKEEKLIQLAKLSDEERKKVLKSKAVTLTKIEEQRLKDIMHNEEVKTLVAKFKKSAKNQKKGFWEEGWTNFEEKAPIIESVYINAWEQAGETLKMRSLTVRSAIMFSLLIASLGVGFFFVIGVIY